MQTFADARITPEHHAAHPVAAVGARALRAPRACLGWVWRCRRLLCAAAVAGVVGVLCACGGRSGADPTSQASPSPAAASADAGSAAAGAAASRAGTDGDAQGSVRSGAHSGAEAGGEDSAGAPSAPDASAAIKAHVEVSAAQLRALGIALARARPAATVPVATLPATLAPPPNARVAVATTLPGVVTRIFVTEGDRVVRGERLATVASREVVTLSADLMRAQAQLAAARANDARLSQLSSEGVVAGARSDEARALLRQAQSDVREHQRLLEMSNAARGSDSYALLAPIDGRISAMRIEAGAPVDTARAPFVIDAADELEATAQLPERLIGRVQPGMAAVLAPNAHGTVTSVGSALDPTTRSATLKASLPASVRAVAGGTLTLRIDAAAPPGAVQVPAGAVTMLAGHSVVFVRDARGFAVQRIRIADGGDSTQAVVLEGLRAGEQVATRGVSELKALAIAE